MSNMNMQNNIVIFGDNVSVCSSDHSNIPTLNKRTDPEYPECTLYDGTIQGYPEPIPHDNSNFDTNRYLQKYTSVIAHEATRITTHDGSIMPTNTSDLSVLKDTKNRLYGTLVIVHIMFTFAIMYIITVVSVDTVKFT